MRISSCQAAYLRFRRRLVLALSVLSARIELRTRGRWVRLGLTNQDGLGTFHQGHRRVLPASGAHHAGDGQAQHPQSGLALRSLRVRGLWDRFKFIYTLKYGSSLNMAEIEINVMVRQCPKRRIADIDTACSNSSASIRLLRCDVTLALQKIAEASITMTQPVALDR